MLGLVSCRPAGATKDETSTGLKETAGAEDQPYRIGYSCMDIEDTMSQLIYERLTELCEDRNITLYFHDGKSDVAQQISMLEHWIGEELDAVICSPVDPITIQSSVDMCMASGIPFICMDSECERKTVYIGVSQYDYGYQAGKIAAKWINDNLPDQNVVTCGILDTPQSFDYIARTNGIIAGLTENCHNAKITAHKSFTTEKDAFAAAWDILEKNINIDCMITATEAGIAGAYSAFLATGINTKSRCIVGLGSSEEVLELIAADTIVRGTVEQGTGNLAQQVLDVAIDAIEGKEVSRLELKIVPITLNSIQDHIDH